MQTDNFIIGLDIGTHYIKASALSCEDSTLMYGCIVESQGTDKNGITDVKALASAIKKVVGKLEVRISRNIRSVFVCLQPEFVRLIDAEGRAHLLNETVSQYDIDKALDGAQLISLSPDEEIVDVVITDCYVDDTAYQDPMGIRGKNLEISAQLVLAKKEYVELLYDALAAAKLKVAGTGLSSVAAASILITRKNWKNGAILVDTGANTTRATFVQNNRIIDSEVFSLGGKSITRDIAIVMKISLLEAEEIKKSYARNEMVLEEDKHELIEEIIRARVLEIMSFVEKFTAKHAAKSEIRKIVVYGGGLCGFTNINNLYKSSGNQSTNFVTSDIIRDDSVFNIQSGGLVYHLRNAIHCREAIEEIVKDDHEEPGETNGQRKAGEDNYADWYQSARNPRQDRTDMENGDQDDDMETQDIVGKIIAWFKDLKNKIMNR